MKRPVSHIAYYMCICICTFLILSEAQAQGSDEWLNRKVNIGQIVATRYQMLREVSEQSGFLFVYDSRTFNNDEIVHVDAKAYTLREAIYAIVGSCHLKITSLGDNYIHLSIPKSIDTHSPLQVDTLQERYFTLTGTVYDLFSKEPLSSASVSVPDVSLGTVTNKDGRFRITLRDTLRQTTIRISHVGYESLEIKAVPETEESVFMLEPQIVSLQEIVVRAVNPQQTVKKMLQERSRNYSSSPVYFTGFYREGIVHKKRNVDLTEGVLKIYKSGYAQAYDADLVKLIKMRRIQDVQERDTLVTKVKSGIHSILLLDVMKDNPDFLEPDNRENPFLYTHTDVVVIDDRLANAITFEQRKEVKRPLYRGTLFIDTENYALLEARFEIHPAYVEKATNLFVEKKSKHIKLTLRSAQYTVSYKPSADGMYHMNHVRGDLQFRVRQRKQWLSSTLNVWFEWVNCKVETEQVQPFSRSERLSPRTVFSETKHAYDAHFWEYFNVILPEEELKGFIQKNLTEVLEIIH